MAQKEAFEGPLDADREVNPSAVCAGAVPEVVSSYCPRCSARLAARSCKLICPSCGYYMSCSDFY